VLQRRAASFAWLLTAGMGPQTRRPPLTGRIRPSPFGVNTDVFDCNAPDGRMGGLVLVALAQFIVILDTTIVNVAPPSIQSSFGLSPENLQWVVTAYTLVFGGFLLLGGRLADLFGRKRWFTIAASCAMKATAPSTAMMLQRRG
jgi:hypothetical protein